jgi:hypothetical protein
MAQLQKLVSDATKLIIMELQIPIMRQLNSRLTAQVVIHKQYGLGQLSIMMGRIFLFTQEITMADGLYVPSAIRIPLTSRLVLACPPVAMPSPRLTIITGVYLDIHTLQVHAITAIREVVRAKLFCLVRKFWINVNNDLLNL